VTVFSVLTQFMTVTNVELLRGTVLANFNWKMIFCGHYMSVFINCDVIGLQSYRIQWNNAK